MDTLIQEVELLAKEKEAEGAAGSSPSHPADGWEPLMPETGQPSTLGRPIPVLPNR
jgi:(E)-4-hydroxy-3-methylbut-2-enyl-diphosphate synthase